MFDLNKPLDRVRLTRDLYNLVDIMKEEGSAETLGEVVDYKEAVAKAMRAGMKSLNTKRGPGDDEGGSSKRQKTDGNTTTGGGGGGDGGGKFIFKSVTRHMLTINQTDKVRETQRTASPRSGWEVTTWIPMSSRMVAAKFQCYTR
jgi:hypothetical protein